MGKEILDRSQRQTVVETVRARKTQKFKICQLTTP